MPLSSGAQRLYASHNHANSVPYATPSCNTTQTHAKAYPGIRELRVLKAFGDLTGNAVTTSICPKTLVNSDSYGYGPAVAALVNTLKPVLLP